MTSLLASAPTAGFTPASVDYWAIAPMLVVVGGALVVGGVLKAMGYGKGGAKTTAH